MSGKRILEDAITDKLVAQVRDGIGWITFNDPQRHNAVSVDMWEAIPIALDAFAADPSIRAVVLTGAGERAFVSGANIAQFDTLRAGESAVETYERIAEGAQLALYDFPKPTVARINGYCIGGGLNIALCCDLRIASDTSIFLLPAARLGLGYRISAIRNLVTVVGAAAALEIFLTAARFDAAEALRLGILQRVAAPTTLDASLGEWLDALLANAPLTMKAGKAMIRQFQRIGPEVDLEAMRSLIMDCFASEDYREGRKAFAEKRQPIFKGN